MNSAICLKCHKNQSSHSAVVNGVYYKHICDDCLSGASQVSSGHARWNRSVDLEDHQFDLAQPYNADGSPNADFIKMYKKQSEALFSKEDMDKALRA